MAKEKSNGGNLGFGANVLDCMVALPGPPFCNTKIPVCLWFLAESKNADTKRSSRDRRQQNLFIDAHKLSTLIDRVHRELTAPGGSRRLWHSFQNN